MARARNIKPGLFKNELLGVQDPIITLLFISLWTLADKKGRLEDRPLRIKAETFPYRESLDINGYLTVLEQLGFIVRYEADNHKYIQVINFEKHQSPHKTEKESTIPENTTKTNGCKLTVNTPLFNDGLTASLPPDSLIPDSLIPDSNKNMFDLFWSAYPRKDNKKKSETTFNRLSTAKQEQAIADCQIRYIGVDRKYIPMPTTYLNGERWNDELIQGVKNETHQPDTRSRAKRVSDKLDEIARRDIEQNGFTEFMG